MTVQNAMSGSLSPLEYYDLAGSFVSWLMRSYDVQDVVQFLNVDVPLPSSSAYVTIYQQALDLTTILSDTLLTVNIDWSEASRRWMREAHEQVRVRTCLI
jgi:hypothetical protein